MNAEQFIQWMDDSGRRPLVMGILNVTPDSFSDGGNFADVERAERHAHEMAAAGADLIDIGGESTRPGSRRIPAEEQIGRIIPVLRRLTGKIDAALSVDTTLARVARAAMDEGATIINDISAGREDPGILQLAAERSVPLILMHMLGEPATMQANPQYQDVVSDVMEFLKNRMEAAEAAGVARGRILLDPGIGFGKTLEHNLQLLRDLRKLGGLDRPLVVGTSRKAFIGRITGEAEPSKRIFGSAASVAWCVTNGAGIVRVHDVEPTVQVVRMVRAVAAGKWPVDGI